MWEADWLNADSIRLLLLPPILLAEFALVWFFVGRDPKPDTIIPLYRPPAGMSPGYMASLKWGFYPNAFLGDLLWLMEKGLLHIRIADGTVVLRRGKETADGGVTGRVGPLLLDRLFPGGRQEVDSGRDMEILASAYTWLEGYYSREQRGLWRKNSGALLFALGLSVCIGVYWVPAASLKPCADAVLLNLILIFLWGLGIFFIIMSRAEDGETEKGGSKSILDSLLLIVSSIFSFLFPLWWYVPFFRANPLESLVSGLCWCIFLFFFWIMPAYDKRAMRDLEAVQGLNLYLETAELPRLAEMVFSEVLPRDLDPLLPYAVALGLMDAGELGESWPSDIASAANSTACRREKAWSKKR